MHFLTTSVDVQPWIPPLVAFAISVFTSMGGVSGAFLLLPYQVSVLGFTSPAVSATNQLFNVVAIPSGVWRYCREGRMVWPLTWVVVVGTIPGVFLGALVRIRYLPDPQHFKLFAGLVLLFIALRLLRDLSGRKLSVEMRLQNPGPATVNEGTAGLARTTVNHFTWAELSYRFLGETYRVSTWKIWTISVVVGIVGGVYGIGGGAIMSPVFVAFFRLPVYTIAGACLMGTFVTSIAGVLFYQILAPFYPGLHVAPDWLLGTLFGIGGFAGMYCGACLQKRVSARFIQWILSACILFLSVRYIWEFAGRWLH
jgi:uncharacterized membrane protein YfcA